VYFNLKSLYLRCLCHLFSAKTAWQLVNRKADFFTKRIDSNRELECSTSRRLVPRVLFYIIVTPAGGLVSRASRYDPTRGHSPQCCSSSATAACSIEMIGNGFLHPYSFSFTFPSLNSCFRFHGFPIVLFPFPNTRSKTIKCKCKQSTVEQQKKTVSQKTGYQSLKNKKMLKTLFTIL